MNEFSQLTDFIDRAVNNRNYAPNTAFGLKAALKLYQKELNEEELSSLDKIKSRIEQITNIVAGKNKQMSAPSMKVYQTRVLKVINDFQTYGNDVNKMAGWSPSRAVRSKKATHSGPTPSKSGILSSGQEMEQPISAGLGMQRFEKTLRPGVKAIVIIPDDITKAESDKIKATLDTFCID